MGILEKLKEKFKLKDYKEMTPTEMLSLDDENLTKAIWHRYLSKLVGEPVANVLAELSGARRVYYILYTFDMLAGIGMKGEVYCLENDKDILPFLISALEEVGAYENKRLVEDFADKYNLDLNNLNEDCFEKLRMKNEDNNSPVDEFGEAYFKMVTHENELYKCLLMYVRQHIEEF